MKGMGVMYREKLVSVIMPVYNAETYIREAIESILNQTYGKFEFIIINDGSTDGSLDIVLEYRKQDDRIVLISRKNKGLVASLNDGIRYAGGEYIARMDADDVSHPERFEKQVRYLNENPNVYLLGTNFNIIYENGMDEALRKRYEGFHRRSKETIDASNVLLSISEGQKFVHPTIMLRKETFDIVGVYSNYMGEDVELYFRIAAKGLGITKLEEELLSYRARGKSKSSMDDRAAVTSEIIRMKLHYLIKRLDDSFRSVKYLIWGADVSGDAAYKVLAETLPDAECLAYIDPMKDGEWNGVRIVTPEESKSIQYDYVFICTQAGAKPAREFLKENGKKEVEEFFKIS